jgi:menaquinol-cytochrome c reductase iron-sulfur subunit
MQRRAFLKWAIHGMNAVFGAVLGIPAVFYLIDARNRPARETGFRTVASLNDLVVETPKEFIIKETRTDAWNLYPDDVIGRVWLIRHEDDKVDAFTTICPHLGCSVNWLDSREFLCPCHGGRFKPDGSRVLDGGNNPAPRSMDSLRVEVNDDPQNPGTKVVKVEYLRFKTNQSAKEEDK